MYSTCFNKVSHKGHFEADPLSFFRIIHVLKNGVMMIPASGKGHTTHIENLFNLNIPASFTKVDECQNFDNLLSSSSFLKIQC